jgi:hypothetical protein
LIFQDIQDMLKEDLVECFLNIDEAEEDGSIKFKSLLG